MSSVIPEEIRILNPTDIDFNNQEAVKTLILKLLNIIELQAQIIENLQKENQELKNEINRLRERSIHADASLSQYGMKKHRWQTLLYQALSDQDMDRSNNISIRLLANS